MHRALLRYGEFPLSVDRGCDSVYPRRRCYRSNAAHYRHYPILALGPSLSRDFPGGEQTGSGHAFYSKYPHDPMGAKCPTLYPGSGAFTSRVSQRGLDGGLDCGLAVVHEGRRADRRWHAWPSSPPAPHERRVIRKYPTSPLARWRMTLVFNSRTVPPKLRRC
jgi:hypothetical protein